MAKPNLQELPEKTAADYQTVLLHNVIEAYRVFQSDSMALDYCKVLGKQRTFILDNPEYKQRTRFIRAEMYLQEIDDIEQLLQDLGGTEPSTGDIDIRDSKDPDKEYQKQYKDWFAMSLKARDMRRELLNLSRKEDEREEADALNIFFIPLSKEEFEEMKNIEIQEGSEDAADALADEPGKDGPQAAKQILAQLNEHEIEGGYKVNTDGSVEDF